MSTVNQQRTASVAAMQNYQVAKSKAAQVAAAKAKALAAKSAPVPVLTPVQIAESQEHHEQAQAATDALHRLLAAQAHAHSK